MERRPQRAFSVFAAIVIIAHAAVFFWHLFVAANIPPGLPNQQVLFVAAAVNVAPVIGLILMLLRIYRLAAVLILLPMAVIFAIGGYEHFVSDGPDNVFLMPASEWALSFKITAILLIILEFLGCLIGVRSWALRAQEQA